MKIPKKSSENRLLSPRCAVGWEIVSWNVKIVSVGGSGVRLMRSVAWCAGKKTACHGGCPWHAVWGGLQVWRACRRLTFCQCSVYTWDGPRVFFLTVGDWEAGCFFFNDNTDNRNNGKNGRNCGCHEVTYNTDNGITSTTENVVIVVVSVVFVFVKREGE